jgi:hypothetical protein
MQEKYFDNDRVNASQCSAQEASPKESESELHGVEPFFLSNEMKQSWISKYQALSNE